METSEIFNESRRMRGVKPALGEIALFAPGDRVRVGAREPIAHYRVPRYLRGKSAVFEAVIEPAAVDNEAEAYGRNAGSRLHYYRLAVAMTEIWPDYTGSPRDGPAERGLRNLAGKDLR